MSDSPDRAHGPPRRGAGAGAAAGRDHRDMGHDGRGLKEALAQKDQEIQKLNRQLEKTVAEMKKWKEHSKTQSKKIQELQVTPEQKRTMKLLEEEISQLKETVERQGYSLCTLEKEKQDLVNDVEVAKTAAAVYKEDFERERRDRERAAAKINTLEEQAKQKIESQQRKEAEQNRQIDLLLKTEAQQRHKLAENFQREIDEERKKFEEAQEEVHMKASLVKQYKKQVEALQRDLKEAQEQYEQLAKCLDVEESVQPDSEHDKQDLASSQKPSKSKNPFAKKRKDMKTLEREKVKAAKNKREKKMKEDKEKWKKKMSSMDEKKQREYLEKKINELQDEILTLHTQLECSESTSRFLVDKLNQTETMVKFDTNVVQGTSHQSVVRKHSDGQLLNITQDGYVTVPQLWVDGRPHRDQGEHETKPPRHGGLQQDQRWKPVTTPHYETVASSASVSQHRGNTTEQQDVLHEQLHKHKQQQTKLSTGQQEVMTPFDPKDPNLTSKDMDYVNLLPAKGYVNYNVPSKSQGEAYLDQFRPPKPPKPSPRSVSMDTGRGSPLLPPSNTPNQTTSMPERRSYTDENDPFDKIGDDIRHEAAEVVATGRDERRFTLSEIPFDPFLECLYCNQKFRYGEIQKYRKHVNTCAGSV